jgi:hypothetical protein
LTTIGKREVVHQTQRVVDGVMMYNIETKAICCHSHFGQFLGSLQTLGGGGGGYFCRFYLAVFTAVFIARTTVNKHRIMHNLYF